MPKCFGIGLERTGTTSLAAAMRQLGFSVAHFPASLLDIEANDFSDDITVSYRFETLDRLFPGSKFILTVRNQEQWLDSCERWHGPRGDAPMEAGASVGWEALLAIYGTTTFDRARWWQAGILFQTRVRKYFANRPSDLLEMNICDGDGWEKLAPFVLPLRPFPCENVFPVSTESSPTEE